MSFIKEKTENPFLLDTKIENIFITEYMATAPGDYIKVFLVSSMYAEIGEDVSFEDIGRLLFMPVEEVEKAFIYFESIGLISKKENVIQIRSLKENLFGKKTKEKESIFEADDNAAALLENKGQESMYRTIEKSIGRPLNGRETQEILSWQKEYHASPEMIGYAYSYASKKGKDNIRYIGAIVKSWVGKGLTNILDLEKYLSDNDERHYVYKRIMQALGFSRNATEEEKKKIDTWVDNMGFAIDEILDACKKTTGISNPNINYINSILSSWSKTGKSTEKPEKVTSATIQSYYNYLKEDAEKKAEERKMEVHKKFPEISQIDGRIRECSMKIAKEMVSGGVNKLNNIEKLKNEINILTDKQTKFLTENNIPIDYMEAKFTCSLCQDTGTKDTGERCDCYNIRAGEVFSWLKTRKK